MKEKGRPVLTHTSAVVIFWFRGEYFPLVGTRYFGTQSLARF